MKKSNDIDNGTAESKHLAAGTRLRELQLEILRNKSQQITAKLSSGDGNEATKGKTKGTNIKKPLPAAKRSKLETKQAAISARIVKVEAKLRKATEAGTSAAAVGRVAPEVFEAPADMPWRGSGPRLLHRLRCLEAKRTQVVARLASLSDATGAATACESSPVGQHLIAHRKAHLERRAAKLAERIAFIKARQKDAPTSGQREEDLSRHDCMGDAYEEGGPCFGKKTAFGKGFGKGFALGKGFRENGGGEGFPGEATHHFHRGKGCGKGKGKGCLGKGLHHGKGKGKGLHGKGIHGEGHSEESHYHEEGLNHGKGLHGKGKGKGLHGKGIHGEGHSKESHYHEEGLNHGKGLHHGKGKGKGLHGKGIHGEGHFGESHHHEEALNHGKGLHHGKGKGKGLHGKGKGIHGEGHFGESHQGKGLHSKGHHGKGFGVGWWGLPAAGGWGADAGSHDVTPTATCVTEETPSPKSDVAATSNLKSTAPLASPVETSVGVEDLAEAISESLRLGQARAPFLGAPSDVGSEDGKDNDMGDGEDSVDRLLNDADSLLGSDDEYAFA